MRHFIASTVITLSLSIFPGQLAWAVTPSPSPTPSPVPSPTPVPGQVWISEVLPNPVGTDTGNEWIELFNPTDQSLSISDLKVTRQSGTTLGTVPANTTLPGKGYYLLINLASSIVNSGDTLLLLAGTTELDRITYPADMAEGQSWSRETAEQGRVTDQPTPGAENSFPSSEEAAADQTAATEAPTAAASVASTKATAASTKAKASTSKAAAKKLPAAGPGLMAYLLPLVLLALPWYNRRVFSPRHD